MVLRTRGRHDVRILLVGERGVGKTSLILSLVSEEFPEDVPPRAEEITIPADVTPEQVPTHIVDYSVVEQTEEGLVDEVHRAHVICVVYAVDDEDTLSRVTSHWLPYLRAILGEEQRTPFILVGNKVDLVDYSTMEAVLPIMNKYAEIETCVECSAKTLKNISEMFYYAQKAVLHPTAPLYMPDEKDLTDRCKKALVRIFKICDTDNDGLLSDDELNAFQRRCFNAPLQPQHLEDVKTVVRRNVTDGVYADGLTLKGFLFLHCLFIQKGRHETTWTVLRKFGNDDNLQLSKDYLFPHIKVPSGCTSELSHSGIQFLTVLFEKYDKDCDGALSPQEQINLFSTCPVMPWGPEVANTVVTDDKGYITLQGYLAQWTLTTFLDLPKMLEHLAYFGYFVTGEKNQLSAIQVTREKHLDLAKKQTTRTVYQCHVIGPRYGGKTTFCHGMLGRTIEDMERIPPEEISRFVINTVQVYGQEKYLVLQDIDVHSVTDALMPTEVQCDVACLVFDMSNPRSFEYVARIYLKYFAESRIPVLIVGNKSDLTEVRQEYIMQPDAFCQRHKLPPPQVFTCTGRIKKDIYVKLATMAAFPNLRRLVHMLLLRPNPADWVSTFRHLQQLGLVPHDNLMWLKAGLGIAAVTAVGFLVVRAFKSDRR